MVPTNVVAPDAKKKDKEAVVSTTTSKAATKTSEARRAAEPTKKAAAATTASSRAASQKTSAPNKAQPHSAVTESPKPSKAKSAEKAHSLPASKPAPKAAPKAVKAAKPAAKPVPKPVSKAVPKPAAHPVSKPAPKAAPKAVKAAKTTDRGVPLATVRLPAPKHVVGDGYSKDEPFLAKQRAALEAERATYIEQAASLRAEAESLVEEMEPGDIQFDDESGEGGTVTVDRERDLALSAQALAAVEEIDHTLGKIRSRTYGICENCGRLISKARLEALPYVRLCIDCKSGGLSRR